MARRRREVEEGEEASRKIRKGLFIIASMSKHSHQHKHVAFGTLTNLKHNHVPHLAKHVIKHGHEHMFMGVFSFGYGLCLPCYAID